ncbi:hypothetical protein SprV_0301361700 [Sparganum proliferum]
MRKVGYTCVVSDYRYDGTSTGFATAAHVTEDDDVDMVDFGLIEPGCSIRDRLCIAAERFAALRQTARQSIDDFATGLTRLASAAFPNLSPTDRDDLILHRFISGLLDHTITDSFLLHSPRILNDALRQCRLYLTYPPTPSETLVVPNSPRAQRPQIDGTPCLSVSLITTLAASTAQPSDPEHATAATTHLVSPPA